MAQKYTEEQKAAVLGRIAELGVKGAAEEAGIPWQTVAKWNKAAAAADAGRKIAEADTQFSEAAAKIAEADSIVDKADTQNAKAVAEAVQEKKEEIQDTVDAARIEAKKKTRSAGRKLKEKVKDAKLSVEAKVEDVKDSVAATKIEAKKKTVSTQRKAKERKAAAKEKIEEAKRPIRKAKAAKMDIVLESNSGMQITPEEIAQKVPKGCNAAYVKLEENKIYWVKGTETGDVDIW